MRHQEFLAGVTTRGGFESTDEARHGADAVLATLAAHLPDDDRRALARALPTLLEEESGVDDQTPEEASPSTAQLAAEVARRAGWSTEPARYALTAVVDQLAAEDHDLGTRLARLVPTASGASGPALPPDAGSEGTQGRPQPVDADELARALDRLVDWSGDVSGIVRTVELPDERIDLVRDRIHTAERDLGARVRVVDRQPGSLTVRARTESLGVVTTLDLALAERVDDAVATVGSGG